MTDHNGHPESLRSGAADLLNDVASLAELQWQLFAIDADQARGRALRPAVALALSVAVAVAMVLGVVPVLLLGLAHLLIEYAAVPAPWAYLLVAAVTAPVAVVICGLIARWAVAKLTNAVTSFKRSRDELSANIQWMRRVVKAHGSHEGLGSPPEQSVNY